LKFFLDIQIRALVRFYSRYSDFLAVLPQYRVEKCLRL